MDYEDEIRFYFWNEGVVEEVSSSQYTGVWQKYGGMLCVDVLCKGAESRYGIYNYAGAWIHMPLRIFPIEFQMSLILLGVQ